MAEDPLHEIVELLHHELDAVLERPRMVQEPARDHRRAPHQDDDEEQHERLVLPACEEDRPGGGLAVLSLGLHHEAIVEEGDEIGELGRVAPVRSAGVLPGFPVLRGRHSGVPFRGRRPGGVGLRRRIGREAV